MKKIFTLCLGLVLTVATFAADRRPIVTISAARKYLVAIDGKRFHSNGDDINISRLSRGEHEIEVYAIRRGFFGNSRRLIASSEFRLRSNDVLIQVDRFGQIEVSKSGLDRDWSDHDHDRDWRNDHHWG